jgi:hypothetical protein
MPLSVASEVSGRESLVRGNIPGYQTWVLSLLSDNEGARAPREPRLESFSAGPLVLADRIAARFA